MIMAGATLVREPATAPGAETEPAGDPARAQ